MLTVQRAKTINIATNYSQVVLLFDYSLRLGQFVSNENI